MNKCYLDVDGVLADFTTAALKIHNKHIDYADLSWDFYKQLGITEEEFWEPLNYDFWFNLEKTKEADQIVDVVTAIFGVENVVLLTSPCDTKGCVDGKLDWVKKHYPQFRRQTFVGGNKYLVGNKDTVLIDDSDVNIDKYRDKGYPAWLVPRPWNKRKHLESPLFPQILHANLSDFKRIYNIFYPKES